MAEALVKAKLNTPFQYLMLLLALLSVLVGVHAEILDQHTDGVSALISEPYKRLFGPDPNSVLLSAIVGSPPAVDTGAANGSIINTPEGQEPYYIFVLDVSKSMAAKISAAEFSLYSERFGSDANGWLRQCLDTLSRDIEQGEERSGFDIAQLELCKFFARIPLPSKFALWTFGDDTLPHVPAAANEKNEVDRWGPKFISLDELNQSPDGAHPLVQARNALFKLKPTDDVSDFLDMIDEIYTRYRVLIETGQTVHFVIVSDFILDLGDGITKSDLEKSEQVLPYSVRQSSYDAAVLELRKKFLEIGSSNAVFHLTAIRGSRPDSQDVLRLAGNTLDWFSRRRGGLTGIEVGSEFDYLWPYRATRKKLTFFYEFPGQYPQPLEIECDMEEFHGKSIKIAVAHDGLGDGFRPIRLKVKSLEYEKETYGIVETNGGSSSTLVEGVGERLTVEPLSRVSTSGVGSFRLLVSVDTSEKKYQHTLAVPIDFSRRLGFYGASFLFLVEVAIMLLSLYCSFRLLWAVYQVIQKAPKGEATRYSPTSPRTPPAPRPSSR